MQYTPYKYDLGVSANLLATLDEIIIRVSYVESTLLLARRLQLRSYIVSRVMLLAIVCVMLTYRSWLHREEGFAVENSWICLGVLTISVPERGRGRLLETQKDTCATDLLRREPVPNAILSAERRERDRYRQFSLPNFVSSLPIA